MWGKGKKEERRVSGQEVSRVRKGRDRKGENILM